MGPFDETLRAAQAGSEWAFEELYRGLNPRLVRYFASRAPAEAQDLCSETWMGVARHIGSFRGDADDFRRWLFTIAHHRLVQHYRSLSRRRDQPVPGPELDTPIAGPDPSNEVVDSLSAVAAAREISSALSADQAEIVLLRVLGGFSVEEVADIVGKRPGTVRVTCHRALKKLAAADSPAEVTP